MDNNNNRNLYGNMNMSQAPAGQMPVYDPAYQVQAQSQQPITPQPMYQQPVQAQPAYQTPVQSQTPPAAKSQTPLVKKVTAPHAPGVAPTVKKVAQPKKTPKYVWVLLTAIVLVIVIVMSTVVVPFFLSAYKWPVNTYYKSLYSGEFKYAKYLVPSEAIDTIAEKLEMSREEVLAQAEISFDEYYEEQFCGEYERYGDFKELDIEVVKERKLSDKKLKIFKKNIASVYGIDRDYITQVYELNIEGEAVFEDGEEEIEDEIYSVKIKGRWYLMSDSDTFLGLIFFGPLIREKG